MIEQEVEKCPEARLLRTHPGVGALTALAFVLIIGKTEQFQCGKQIAAYLGLSWRTQAEIGDDWAISLSKGVRCCALLVEAAQVTARSIPEWCSKYFHLASRTEDRQGGDGAETGYRSLLDVAQGMELRSVKEVRFARGQARNKRWCAVEHREIDWAARSSSSRSSK